jgi:uncharacterized membrane protein SirB2
VSYTLVKHVHVAAAAIVVLLFLLRGYWMLTESPMLERKWVRIVPHVNDTILFAAALWLATEIGFVPFVAAKLAALVGYIVLGAIALRYGRTKAIRVAAFCASIAVLGYLAAVGVTKSPTPFL